jgi:hypothetical protein
VLLAVIGTRWLTLADDKGQNRLQNPKDYVRREIGTALKWQIKVIPVLVGGARMPHAVDLPADLAGLAQCQALLVSDVDFHHDVSRLIEVLQVLVKPPAPARARVKTVRLRVEQAALSNDDVKVMLITRGFYCRGWNDTGKGIDHEYKTMVQGGAIVVLDKATNLMWQESGSGECFSFADAHICIDGLNSRKFGGFADWRVPTLEEAMSLMSPAKQDGTYLPAELDGAPILWTADKYAG